MIEIRLADPFEYERVGQLTLASYEHAEILGTDPGYVDSLADARARARESELLVAVDHGLLAGTVTYCPFGTPHAEVCGPGEAEFRMLAVDPAFAGQGIGRALVNACEDRARAADCERLVLSVIVHNDKAARLYDRMGFARAQSRDWAPFPGVDLLVWEKSL